MYIGHKKRRSYYYSIVSIPYRILLCQFLIGNVYQLVLSVSNYDTTPFSSQNQSKMFKKSVDLQQLRLCKPMILQHSILFLNYSLTSTGFLSKNYAN